MKIESIDKNFESDRSDVHRDLKRYSVPNGEFDLYGVFYDEKRRLFMRMDGDVADRVSDAVGYLATHTSGGRLRFSTDSKVIGISVKYNWLLEMPHMPLTGSCGFALTEKDSGVYRTVSVFRPNHDEKEGYSGKVTLSERKRREYVLFFPLYNCVSELSIYLEQGAAVYKPEKYRPIAPILYYGASIDQGGCASRPDSAYTSLISKWNDIDYVNLGFSGNCKGEQLMAQYISGIDCSMLFMAYDGNAPDAEFLEKTHYPFYETFRSKRRNVPVVFMSVPCFDGFPQVVARREVIKKSYRTARENGDENVYFIDGEKLFGVRDREICTVEGIHPNDLGFYRMAEGIYETFGKIDPKFVK